MTFSGLVQGCLSEIASIHKTLTLKTDTLQFLHVDPNF